MSRDVPPYPPSQKQLTGGQQDKGYEMILHDQGEGYKQPKTFNHEGVLW